MKSGLNLANPSLIARYDIRHRKSLNNIEHAGLRLRPSSAARTGYDRTAAIDRLVSS